MPITYRISTLADLFGGIQSKTAEWISDAKISFIQGTNTYCNGKCKVPTPDKPLPRKIPTTYNAVSTLYGGNGGNNFNYNFNEPDWQVVRVIIRSARYLDGIQIQLSNPNGQTTTSPYFGGNGGNVQ